MIRSWPPRRPCRPRRSLCAVLVATCAATLAGCGDAARAPRSPDAAGDAAPAPPLRHLLVATLLNPERLVVADLRNGRVVAERKLPGGTLCGGSLLLLGDRVVLPVSGRDEVSAASLDLSLRGRPRPLGAAARFVASATPGRIWLVGSDLARDARPTTSLREVDADGRVTRNAHGRPPAGWLNAAALGGLVFERGGRLAVWDPSSGQRTATLPGGAFVAAAGGSRLAWCGDPCRRVTFENTVRRETFPAPRGTSFLPAGGAFAPHGRPLLALRLGPFERPRLALLDVRAGTTAVVRGRTARGAGTPVWSASGDRLYYAGAHGRVYSHRPGAERPQPTRVRFGEPVAQLVAAG